MLEKYSTYHKKENINMFILTILIVVFNMWLLIYYY